MGCFHSIPSRLPAVEPANSTTKEGISRSDPLGRLADVSLGMHEISEIPGDVGNDDLYPRDFVVVEDTDSEELFSVSVTSPERYVRSDLAEDTASRSADSVDALGDTETPDPIVSPNPVSPSQEDSHQHIIRAPTPQYLTIQPREIPVAISTPPGSIRFSSSTLPMADSTTKTIPMKSSRLIEVADLRNSKLCLQVFGVWRSDVLKNKVETLNRNLDMAGKASEIILAENDQLKAKLEELTNYMRDLSRQPVPAAIPMEAIAVQTDTPLEAPITPQRPLQDVSNFVTPPSARSQLMTTSAFITPPEEPRRSWESVVSMNQPAQPAFQARSSPIPLPVSPSPQSEKFRQLSNDIAKLTESIGKFELKKTTSSSKTPTTSAVTPISYTYTP